MKATTGRRSRSVSGGRGRVTAPGIPDERPSEGVEPFVGQRSFSFALAGIVRQLPLIEIESGTWIASNASLILGDVAFIETAARLLREKLRPRKIDLIVTAEAKCIALAYALSKELGRDRFVVARKSPKAYMKGYLAESVKSITTRSHQRLLLTSEEALELKDKRVCLLDDVVSTGATLRALDLLVSRVGGIVSSKAAVWKEGPWYRAQDLIYLGRLPVFVNKGVDPTVPR